MTGEQAEVAIEVAAVGNRIEVRACQQARRIAVLTSQRHEEVGGMIAPCFKSHGIGALGHQLVRKLLTWSIAIAGYAVANTAASAQQLKERGGLVLLANHRLANV